MSSSIQLLSFFISFVFGIFFNLLTILNFKIISNLKKYLQHIITFIYVMDIIIIYVIILYHINNGQFHIYFILMVIIGYVVGYLIYSKLLSKLDVKRFLKHCKNNR